MTGKLDHVFEELYNKHVANTPMRPPDLAQLRKNYSTLYGYGTGPAPKVGRIYDASVTIYPDGDSVDIPLRVYEPESEGPWPVHVDFHGGGWAVGDLDTEGHICQHVCVKANVVVIDVGYRLVPEHPYPTGITDSWEVVKFIHASGSGVFNIKPDSISLGGVSAGATIALALAHLARDTDVPLRLVAAGTPVIDYFGKYATPSESPWSSMRENQFAPCLNWMRLAWFDKIKQEATLPDAGWFLNLLEAPDHANLARTVIYTAGADPLRDEGEAYATKMVQAGNHVALRRFPGVPHPFMHMDNDLWQAREFIDGMAREIRLAHWDT